MKPLGRLSLVTVLVMLVCHATLAFESIDHNTAGVLINRIEGIVWDPYRHPVPDLYVELQNENYTSIGRTRTDSTGRFSFSGVSGGHFNIKVLTTGTNYLEYSEGFDVVNVVTGSSDTVNLDIYLKLDKRKVKSGAANVTEAVFVQDIPEDARKLYKKGAKDITEDPNKGFAEIEQALTIFPNYYDALNTLGCEYVARKEYQKAIPYLIKSIDINRRSFSSFYALAYAAFELKQRPEALEAARAATILQSSSVNAQLLYGTLLRLDGNYLEAEKALVQAERLSKETPVAEIHWQLALLYNRLDRNTEAADELETYLRIQPDARNRKEIQDLITKLRRGTKQKLAGS